MYARRVILTVQHSEPERHRMPKIVYVDLYCPPGGAQSWTDCLRHLGCTEAGTFTSPHGAHHDMQRGTFRVIVCDTRPGTSSAAQASAYGTYVADIALAVERMPAVYARAIHSGGFEDAGGPHRVYGHPVFRIQAPGGILCHTLFDEDSLYTPIPATSGTMDHFALAVPRGELGAYAVMYRALGFEYHPEPLTVIPGGEAIASGWLESGTARGTIVTPGGGYPCAQLDEFTGAYDGQVACQHLALGVDDLPGLIGRTRDQVEWAPDPDSGYYERLRRRLGRDVPAAELARWEAAGIAVDRDAGGELEQKFMLPADEHSQFFLEGVDRSRGATGFGGGNITELALSRSRAMERAAARLTEQQRRG